ncbi:MAG: hypothetical protein ACXVAN_07700 [Polyangia bacterium]
MRSILAASVLLAAVGCTRSAGFTDDVNAAWKQAAALRKGFGEIAALAPADKGPALHRVIDQAGKPLLVRLASLRPPAAQADCTADALGGARRSVGAMQDMVKLYDAGTYDELFGARIVASARNADQGLWTVEDQLRACGAR